MVKYNLQSAFNKIKNLITSGRGVDYVKRGVSLFNDIKNDYSNPAMGKRGKKRRSTPKMGKRRMRKRK